jgi:citrate lyase subunit beta / citryl-CoA lyase
LSPSSPPSSHATAKDRPARLLRSFLYAPGSRETLLHKALEAGADAVICDLEDAVAAADKPVARQAVADLIRSRAAEAACQVHVRVNLGPHGYDPGDLAAAVWPGLAALRLPKATSADEVAEVSKLVDALERSRGLPAGSVGLYPTIESAAGVDAARALAAAPRVVSLAFGGADFLADIGAHGGDGHDATLLARSTLVLASRAADLGRPVDGAYTDLNDTDGLRQSTTWARSLGFFGRSAIHPGQLAVIHEVFTPTPQELAWARQVVNAVSGGGTATAVVAGQFVDAPAVRRARDLLALGGQQ